MDIRQKLMALMIKNLLRLYVKYFVLIFLMLQSYCATLSPHVYIFIRIVLYNR